MERTVASCLSLNVWRAMAAHGWKHLATHRFLKRARALPRRLCSLRVCAHYHFHAAKAMTSSCFVRRTYTRRMLRCILAWRWASEVW